MSPIEKAHLQKTVAAVFASAEIGKVDAASIISMGKQTADIRGKLIKKVNDFPIRRYIQAKGFLDGLDEACAALERYEWGAFSLVSFHAEQEQTLIVYGTADEMPTNREAAKALQKAIRESWQNITIPIKSDKDVSEADLKSHHLLLIGRPDSNTLVERFRKNLPIPFGSRSFVVRGKTYAHPGSAVVVAADNPLNPRFSLVVLAGLSAESTVFAPGKFVQRRQRLAEVLVLPNEGAAQALVIPRQVVEVNQK